MPCHKKTSLEILFRHPGECAAGRRLLPGSGWPRINGVPTGSQLRFNLNPAVGGLREARNRRKPPRWGQKRRVWWFTPRVSNLRLKAWSAVADTSAGRVHVEWDAPA